MAVSWRVLVNTVLLITVVGNFAFLYSMYNAPNRYHPEGHGTDVMTMYEDGDISIAGGRVNMATTTTTATTPQHTMAEAEDKRAHVQSSEPLRVRAYSSKALARISVNDDTVLEVGESAGEAGRGIHVAVINGHTGALMDTNKFDTYVEGADLRLLSYLRGIHPNRIVALAVRDEASFHLGNDARMELIKMGSIKIGQLQWRDTWAMVARVGSPDKTSDALARAPDFNHWGEGVEVSAEFERHAEDNGCNWPDTPHFKQRRAFCARYDGYGELCRCDHPPAIAPSPSPAPPLPNMATTPLVIMASENRPKYLLRSLRSLLAAQGCIPSNIVVSIDGVDKMEAEDVCKLVGVTAMRHRPTSEKNGRISQHYKFALTAMFDRFKDAEHVIVMEEDLDAAPDFFRFFSTALPLLKSDPTLYCISAWNDQGYTHSTGDVTRLYRVETMPGLGWLLSRRLYKQELEPRWPGPDKLWDWDMWMRMNENRKDRECIVPDVSRTFHFGATGLNVNDYFQKLYFAKHRLNDDPTAVVNTQDMTAEAYDAALRRQIAASHILDTQQPCGTMVPDALENTNTPLVLYMTMKSAGDHETWLQLAKCWHLWDLDVRGFHKGVWRFYRKGNPIAVVGTPYSPFSSHKPDALEPLFMAAPKKKQTR
ncbi:histidine-rich glycoprotein [Salpingoeca rosetta]|uniref:Protein O-linked-mannose beta-1,2-N-acetylglucosaminyltransferase 1 n=1 Tax=Salpingoeca rosetta (strain ATCC 50818 / BSB-021) TaxID=946362 RepID=F2UGP3_SALR5|nr:histidine-rich glycoprotein [Salpingoeca rosetta]EGD75793.1 histidine-rich glycoprotein [Salpingoeca rosetta]|eukprot:XP_004991714.1 histidine-rich glycoprotein [Salpingoeca rosetta]